MPRLDGTGPNGQGSKTGRKLGNCLPSENNQNTQIINNQNKTVKPGLGFGRIPRRGTGIGRAGRRGNR